MSFSVVYFGFYCSLFQLVTSHHPVQAMTYYDVTHLACEMLEKHFF